MAGYDSDRVRKIVQGHRAFSVVPFPGSGEGGPTIAVRVLKDAEIDAARFQGMARALEVAAKREWKTSDIADLDPNIYDRFVERAMLWRAFFDPETVDRAEPVRFFPRMEDIEELDAVTITALSNIYTEHMDNVMPLRRLTEDQVEELVDALGKAPEPEVILTAYGGRTLRRLCISLAHHLRSMSRTSR